MPLFCPNCKQWNPPTRRCLGDYDCGCGKIITACCKYDPVNRIKVEKILKLKTFLQKNRNEMMDWVTEFCVNGEIHVHGILSDLYGTDLYSRMSLEKKAKLQIPHLYLDVKWVSGDEYQKLLCDCQTRPDVATYAHEEERPEVIRGIQESLTKGYK